MEILRPRRLARVHRFLLGLLLLLSVALLCKPQRYVTGQMTEQRFFAPEPWARGMTDHQRWWTRHPRLLADVNGDKRQDVVGFGDDGVWLATSTGTSFSLAFVLAGFGFNQGWRVDKHVRLVGDINGDQMEDVVGFGDDGVAVALSTGNGFGPAAFVFAGLGYNQYWRVDKHVRLLADVNGDGKKDIVGFGDDGVWLSLAPSSGFFLQPKFVLPNFGFNQGWTPRKHVRTTADINGDGRQDIIGFFDDGVWVALSTGDGFEPPKLARRAFAFDVGGWRVEKHLRLMVDIDKDGKQDIVGFGDDGVWIARATGSGFDAPQFVLAAFGYNDSWRVDFNPRFVTDLNGDGYQDIVGFGNASVYRALGGPNGFGPMRSVLRALVIEEGYHWFHPHLVGDVNGDGMQDLIAFESPDIKVVRSSNLPPPLPPAAPSNPRFTSYGPTTLSIAWNDNSADERKFFIYLGLGRTDSSLERISRSANSTTEQLGPGLKADTEYCFAVQAENLWGLSAMTRFVCGRTLPEQPPPPPPTGGWSRIDVFNCHSSKRSVYIWTRDVTQSSWVLRGVVPDMHQNGSCPGSAAPFQVPLQDGHSFWFVAVDPDLGGCGVSDDPENPYCQRSTFTNPWLGDANGPVKEHTVY